MSSPTIIAVVAAYVALVVLHTGWLLADLQHTLDNLKMSEKENREWKHSHYRENLANSVFFALIPVFWIAVPFTTGFYQYGWQIMKERGAVERMNRPHVCPSGPFGSWTHGLGRGEHQPHCPDNPANANREASHELEVWLCPVHESLDRAGKLKPLDNCVACLRVERDELLTRSRTGATLNVPEIP